MKALTQYLLTMATLALFSTLTNDVLAQQTSVASMTIRATVVESATLKALNDLRFQGTSVSESGSVLHASAGAARFDFGGTDASNISITLSGPEVLEDEDGNSVVFSPVLRVGDSMTNMNSPYGTNIQLKSPENGYSGRASVWVEGTLEAASDKPVLAIEGRYLVSAVYN